MKQKLGSWGIWRRVRQGVQVATLILFIYLLFGALRTRAVFPLADLFFRLDPLAAVSSMVAARAWLPRIALAGLTVALTLLVGRAWCGWLCPLGTVLEWVHFPKASNRRIDERWLSGKYVLLIATMTAAALGSLSLLIFDPITIITRTMTTAVLPALNHTLTSLARALYPIPFLRRALFAVEGVLRGAVLPIDQPVFRQGLFLALLFAAILSLNRLAHRFWCRYLCPLGGLLGLLAKISLLRPAPASSCNQCGRCAGVCPVDAIHPERDYEVAPSECIVCLDCLADCPHSGYAFELQLKPAQWEAHDPSRRDLLAAVGATAAGVLLLKTGRQTPTKDRALIRPPGVVDEEHFLSRCIRCSQCMKICPTSGLQPALAEAGAEGIWTPVLMPRRGYCEYGCSACGEICPSDAIPTLTLEAKRTQVLGLARIDKDRCLPWAYDTPCIVCEEMCPIPEKAIRLEETIIGDKEGNEVRLQRPRVMRDLCIGCGICEYRCPMGGEAAIRVFHQEPL